MPVSHSHRRRIREEHCVPQVPHPRLDAGGDGAYVLVCCLIFFLYSFFPL